MNFLNFQRLLELAFESCHSSLLCLVFLARIFGICEELCTLYFLLLHQSASSFLRTSSPFLLEEHHNVLAISTLNNAFFTHHCLECLWSNHVDVFPGDR